jgi:hypothetical protein
MASVSQPVCGSPSAGTQGVARRTNGTFETRFERTTERTVKFRTSRRGPGESQGSACAWMASTAPIFAMPWTMMKSPAKKRRSP